LTVILQHVYFVFLDFLDFLGFLFLYVFLFFLFFLYVVRERVLFFLRVDLRLPPVLL